MHGAGPSCKEEGGGRGGEGWGGEGWGGSRSPPVSLLFIYQNTSYFTTIHHVGISLISCKYQRNTHEVMHVVSLLQLIYDEASA